MNKAYLIIFSILIAIVPSVSQGGFFTDVDEIIAGNDFGFSARQMAMGGAGIMSMDGTALFFNPANLARIPRIEFNIGFSNQKQTNETSTSLLGSSTAYNVSDSKTNTRLNSLILTIPYPTWRGSLVFSMGMSRPINFDRVSKLYFRGNNISLKEEIFESGGINSYAFGMGVDLSPRVSFGVSLLLYKGSHELNLESDYYSLTFDTLTNQLLASDYLGVGIKSGLSFQVGQHIGIGLTVELPISYNVQQEETVIINGVDSSGYAEYDVSKPFTFSFGMVGRFNFLTLMADADYTDWSQLSYEDNSEMEAQYNHLFKDYYRDVLSLKFGAEYVLPGPGLSLRGGYFYDPLPFKDRIVDNLTTYDGKIRHGFSLGAGLLIDQVLTLDVAYVHGSYDESHMYRIAGISGTINSEQNTSYNRIFITTAYRF